MAVDEIDPELRHFLGRQRLRQIDRMGLEAIALVDIEKARIGQEHHLVAELLERLADADRIERRPEGRLRKERQTFFGFFAALRAGFLCGFLRRLLLSLSSWPFEPLSISS